MDIKKIFQSKGQTPPELKAVIIIVNRDKAEVFLHMLSDFEVNAANIQLANGSVSEEVLQKLGVGTEKAMITCMAREDKVDSLLTFLEGKFKSIKGGKGIAFSLPLAAIIGVSNYLVLANQEEA